MKKILSFIAKGIAFIGCITIIIVYAIFIHIPGIVSGFIFYFLNRPMLIGITWARKVDEEITGESENQQEDEK